MGVLFNSIEFLFLFFPLSLGVCIYARRFGVSATHATLLASSIVFYGMWRVEGVVLLLAGLAFNYAAGRALLLRKSLRLLWLFVASNLLVLAWFKYAHWIGDWVGLALPVRDLPLGSSLFVFLQIAFLVDCYSGRIQRTHWLSYATFCSYYPHLLAGPILRHNDVVGQLQTLGTPDPHVDERVARGLMLLLLGLLKKVVIADSLAPHADQVFLAPGSAGFYEAWVGALAYTLQIYFDFSAYCEMALGISLIIGLSIPINFYSPYRATSIADFWRRWNVSLGAFMRDYCYIPLGGNRHGLAREVLAISITMLLAGLWHGAGWTFVVWGAMHGLMMVSHRLWRHSGLRVSAAAGQAATLFGVILAWVMFRADTVSDAVVLWQAMFGLRGFDLPQPLLLAVPPLTELFLPSSGSMSGIELFPLVALLAFTCTQPNVHQLNLQPTLRWAGALGCVALLAAFSVSRPSPFLYFQF
jgi:alginate O-acetyltransferase complex protein AlgI